MELTEFEHGSHSIHDYIKDIQTLAELRAHDGYPVTRLGNYSMRISTCILKSNLFADQIPAYQEQFVGGHKRQTICSQIVWHATIEQVYTELELVCVSHVFWPFGQTPTSPV